MPYECDGDSSAKDWRAGLSAGAFRSAVSFDNGDEVGLEQSTVSATLSYQNSTRLGITGSFGAIVDGSVDHVSREDVGSGVLAAVSANYLALFESPSRPFVLLSATIGAATTTAVSDDGKRYRWTAQDNRFGVMVGKTFFDRLVPFATARGFFGPVYWKLGGEDVVGTDIHHYTIGAGASYQVPGRFSLFAEALALGEQSVSLGGSMAF